MLLGTPYNIYLTPIKSKVPLKKIGNKQIQEKSVKSGSTEDFCKRKTKIEWPKVNKIMPRYSIWLTQGWPRKQKVSEYFLAIRGHEKWYTCNLCTKMKAYIMIFEYNDRLRTVQIDIQMCAYWLNILIWTFAHWKSFE